jgi:hypothetical protein
MKYISILGLSILLIIILLIIKNRNKKKWVDILKCLLFIWILFKKIIFSLSYVIINNNFKKWGIILENLEYQINKLSKMYNYFNNKLAFKILDKMTEEEKNMYLVWKVLKIQY